MEFVEPKSVLEMTLNMFEQIGKGRNRPIIRKAVASICKTFSESRELILDSNAIQSNCGLQNKPQAELTPKDKIGLLVSEEIAESAYEFIKHQTDCMPERAECVQLPILTLMKVKGGNFDGLTVILYSLCESIGLEMTFNSIHGHALPSVGKFAFPEKHEEKSGFVI